MMRSGAPRLAACVVACVLPASALAGPTAKVTIESDPPNAKVYLDAIEDGVKCEPTPCSFDAPTGGSSAIVVLEGYEPDIFPLDLRRRGKATYKRTLKRAMGSLRVDGARGVAIEVKDASDGKVKGTGNVPHTFDLPAGQYTVVFSQNGKPFDTEPADVEKDQEVQLTAKPPQTATKPEPKPDEPEPGEEDLGDGTKTVEVKKQAPAKPPRNRAFALGALFDVGARQFSYSGANNTYPDFPYTATHMAGGTLELWPLALFGSRALPGLSLYVRGEFSVVTAPVTGDSVMDTNTEWRSFEASVRQRFVLARVVGLEVSGGYVRDQLLFTGSQTSILPDIDYQSVRIGGKAAYLAGTFEPYAALEARIVLSGGDFTTRFDGGATAEGFHGALGTTVKLGAFVARAEASVTNYTWVFNYSSAPTAGQMRPSGGVDLVTQLVIVAGFQY